METGSGHCRGDALSGTDQKRFGLRSVGAFTYADNEGSVRVLEKNDFVCKERFEEDGRDSVYYEKEL